MNKVCQRHFRVISFKEINKLQVVTSQAQIIGEIKEIKIDKTTWQVKYLDVKLTGDAAASLGMKKRFGSSAICIPTSMIKAIAHVITISKSLEELEESIEIKECRD